MLSNSLCEVETGYSARYCRQIFLQFYGITQRHSHISLLSGEEQGFFW